MKAARNIDEYVAAYPPEIRSIPKVPEALMYEERWKDAAARSRCNPALAYAVIVALLAGSACTSQQLYQTGQEWQRNQCNELPDNAERERCLGQANTRYEDYKRQTEKGQNQ
jgi:hypothetical protein